jgi:DNA-binding transcriptional regulator LsrR (DeoR family)
MAAALPRLDLEVPVVQICGAIPGLDGGTGPSEIAFRISERLSSPFYGLPAPALASPAARDELLRNDAVRPTVELFDRVTVALLGIGMPPSDAPPETAGHLLVYLFDEEGRILTGELEAIALPLARLRAARVIAVAAGRPKHRAVTAALRTGLLDALVTDEPTARYALEHA